MKSFTWYSLSLVLALVSLGGVTKAQQVLCVGPSCGQTVSQSLGAPRSSVPSGQTIMVRQRNADGQQCQAESGGVGGFIEQAMSLQGILGSGLQQTLGSTVQNLFSNKIPGIIQDQITNRLPSLIERGVRDQLPGRISQQVSGMQRRGMSESAIKAALPQIVSQLLQQLISELVKSQTPVAIEEGLRRELPADLVAEFNAKVPEILETGGFNEQINDLVSSTTAELGNLRSRISSRDREEYAEQLSEELATQVQQGINTSSGISDLANSLTIAFSDVLMPQIEQILAPQLNQIFSGGGNSGFGGSVDTTVSGLFGNNFSLSGGISGDVINPIVTSISPSIGQFGWSAGNSIAGAFGNGQMSPGKLQAIGQGSGTQSAEFRSSLGGDVDTSQLDADMGKVSQSGASQASSGSSQAAQNAATKTGALDGLNTSISQGFVSGVSGGLGGLVGGVPYVGGILSPIVQNYTEGFLSGLLGLQPGLGWPVTDVGTQQTVSGGFQESNKIQGKIQEASDQTKENTSKEVTLQTQMCTLEKQLKGVAYRTEEKEFVLDPAARKAAFLAFQELYNAYRDYFTRGYNPGDSEVASGDGSTGQSGESFVADYNLDQERAAEEARADVVSKLQNSENPYASDVVEQIIATQNQFYGQPLAEEECAKLAPDSGAKLTGEEYNELLFSCSNPINYPRGVLTLTQDAMSQAANQAEQEARDRYLANQGVRDTRVCAEWSDNPLEAGNLSDSLTNSGAGDILSGTPLGTGGRYCKRWVTTTPGSSNKSYMDRLLTAFVDFMVNTHEVGEDFINGYQLQPQKDLTNLAQKNDPIPQTNDPCPDTGGCPNTGWSYNQVDTSALNQAAQNGVESLFYNLINGGGDDDSPSGGGSFNLGGLPNFNLPAIDFSALFQNQVATQPAIAAPSISIQQSTVDVPPASKKSTVSWTTGNASVCFTASDWLSGTWPGNISTTTAGDILETTGELSIDYPAGTKVNLVYAINCYNSQGVSNETEVNITNE